MTPLRAAASIGAGIALVGVAAFALLAPRSDLARLAALRGTPVLPPKSASDFVLTAGDGRPAHVLAPGFATTFLFFGYTHCPDECPLAMGSLGRAYRGLTPAQKSLTRVVFVTVDPKRDSPRVVARYVASFGPHIVGLTGTPATLARVWQAYGVSVEATSHEIGHGDTIYAIDRSERVILIYPPDVAAADLASDAAVLAGRT